MGKKRTNASNHVEETPAVTTEQVEPADIATETPTTTPQATSGESTPSGVASSVDAGTAATSVSDVPTENDITTSTTSVKAKAQQAVDAAVGVARATVDTIKTQIGEEKTQMAVQYAQKAKAEVVEVVDFAKETVSDATNKARVKATTKMNETKEKVSTTVADVKEKATSKVTETVGRVKVVAAEKTTKPRQKALEVAEWLKGEVAETPLETSTVGVASVVIASALAVSNSALRVVGLNGKATAVVGVVRTNLASVGAIPIVHSTHTYASQFWPYQLVTRMVSHVDSAVKERLAGTSTQTTNTTTPATATA